MNVTIGGLPGSGKTTVAKILANKLDLNYLNAGDIFRNLATKKGMTLEEFAVYAEQNPSVDQAIDNKLIEVARGGGAILEGRLAAFMVVRENLEARKIWLEAPLKIRAERICQREDKPLETALSEIQERERSEWDRYFNLYNIDLNDLENYDIIIDSSTITADQVVEEVMKGIE
jgi:cytidylate kinase